MIMLMGYKFAGLIDLGLATVQSESGVTTLVQTSRQGISRSLLSTSTLYPGGCLNTLADRYGYSPRVHPT